ncbi:DNA cytosine methyltransferase [Ornithobacterium rhinotracheale]|uniref:DNA (cytosine-5-)-methyltransferase n=1 Tax=Ornithobacterium rhinotracheale TaxID=28251 RepID=UPI00129CBD57|nr:DNA (cytosine-5-)-methyltransferase [Ornithobacterium rhinotracheale]MRJ09409.1 DNA cytosine methyltransferase [Ornithobacterium rhinotracheale]UOH77049.1 DNA (cytosine-5-)-methyltransferase [Ornithobacterium rhinotracheale]
MNKPLTYISLFSSAGVGCFGFKQKGFECIATNEILTKRLKIQTFNNKCKYNSGYLEGDISKKEIKNQLFAEIKKWQTEHKISEPDVIVATPPCQGMSVANHKKNKELTRNSLVVESIKITKAVNPKFFIFENVRAFLRTTCTDIDGTEKPIEDAIKLNLGGRYNILFKVVNFKDYGSHSSRTRTLVIGVRKDLQNISPFDIFPEKHKPKTLRKLFAKLEQLNEMGQVSQSDIFHSFREYNPKMLPWIENLNEGESAFQNTEKERIPHQIKNGKIVFNESKNGDKYARWYWDREGPCVHTRNDILSSQNTVHPEENRVFSIRELMLMMSIPDNFQWTMQSTEKLNRMNLLEKKMFLKKEELNIRHCIGEAVPTGVFGSIAKKIKEVLSQKFLSTTEINNVIKNEELNKTENLLSFINSDFDNLGLENIYQIAEYANSSRQENSAFFTRKDIAFSVVKDLPELKRKKKIRILEPSVGIGNFIPLLVDKYEDKEEVTFDLVDIDSNSLIVLRNILDKLKLPKKFKFNFINTDFLIHNFNEKYDIVVGNPPYKKLTNNQELVSLYKFNARNSETNNLFSFFIEKAISLGNFISLIVPKSLINSPEFNITREILKEQNLIKICDYGEKGFKGVKIETISFLLETSTKKQKENIVIESYITENIEEKRKDYLLSENFPYWLIYRNEEFDEISNKMNFDVFQSFRDRQITKKITKKNGKYRVLKSRNVGNNEIKELENYDCYVDDTENLAVAKFLNRDDVVMIPNLTYYPRASFLPKNTITDGSVALLTLKNGSRLPTEKDLEYYGSKEFEKFYRVARNFGTRSLNIDNNSVFFFGLLKNIK